MIKSLLEFQYISYLHSHLDLNKHLLLSSWMQNVYTNFEAESECYFGTCTSVSVMHGKQNFDMYLTVYVFCEQIGNEHQDKVNHCNNTIPVSMPIQKSP